MKYRLPLFVALFFGVLAILIFSYDLTSSETTNRTESVNAFNDNFGFEPPASVKEIKLKNVALYDNVAHWMAFTYNSLVFEKILEHDNPQSVKRDSGEEFHYWMNRIEPNPNTPNWFVVPDSTTAVIYYKKNFMSNVSCEYYLWHSDKYVYLMVTYIE